MSNIDSVFKALPDNPTEWQKCEIIKRGIISKEVIVYKTDYYYDYLEKRKVTACKCVCSACGSEFYLPFIRAENHRTSHIGFLDPYENEVYHNDSLLCPYCGAEVTAIHTSAFGAKGTFIIQREPIITIHSVDGSLTVCEWVLDYEVDKNGNTKQNFYKYDAISIINNHLVRYAGHSRNTSGHEYFFGKWEKRKRAEIYITNIDRNNIILTDESIVFNSNAEKSGIEEYIKGNREAYPIFYIKTWLKYRNIENLIRSGFAEYVDKVIEESFSRSYDKISLSISNLNNYINFKKVKPFEMLNIDKSEKNILNNYNIKTSKFYRYIKENYKIRLSTDQLNKIDHMNFYYIYEMLDNYDAKPNRLINYCIKHTNDCYLLLDYWRMLKQVYEVIPESERYPGDLRASHDRITKILQDKKNREIDEKIRSRYQDSKQYEMTSKKYGLVIRACSSQQDLIKEGKELHHCVATYANSVANGETRIFFIRKIERPDRPYFTLEYKNGIVLQNRGLNNCGKNETVQAFENQWLKKAQRIGA